MMQERGDYFSEEALPAGGTDPGRVNLGRPRFLQQAEPMSNGALCGTGMLVVSPRLASRLQALCHPHLTCAQWPSLMLFPPTAAGPHAHAQSRQGPRVLVQAESTSLKWDVNTEG